MSKKIPVRLQLDTDVIEMIHRLSRTGYMKLANHTSGYTIDRQQGRPTMVTVTFVADEFFSAIGGASEPATQQVDSPEG